MLDGIVQLIQGFSFNSYKGTIVMSEKEMATKPQVTLQFL